MNSKLAWRFAISIIILSWGFGVGPEFARFTGSAAVGLWVGIPAFALSLFIAVTVIRFGVPK